MISDIWVGMEHESCNGVGDFAADARTAEAVMV